MKIWNLLKEHNMVNIIFKFILIVADPVYIHHNNSRRPQPTAQGNHTPKTLKGDFGYTRG